MQTYGKPAPKGTKPSWRQTTAPKTTTPSWRKSGGTLK